MTAKKLPITAYEPEEGEQYISFTYGQVLTEFTLKAALAGIILGLLFGAANTYLGLKAGLTISTSIPVAVLTVVAFRVFTGLGLRHSILECNMSQTIGSASSSVASGVLFGAGLVGGGGLTGVLLALWVGIRGGKKIEGFPLDLPEPAAEALALLAIAAILGIMAVFVNGRRQA